MNEKIFTVSEIVRDVKTSLESMYPEIWVEGEISNLSLHSSGHCYFSLKDSESTLSAVMFRDGARRLRFRPEIGLQVIVRGRLTLYPAQGKFQLVGSGMEPKGKGALQLAFEQLKARLQKEGLFEESRKKPIPTLPQWIALMTSPDGAALHDMLTVLNRRFANVRILIVPVPVQGDAAAPEIVRSLSYINQQYPQLDVILLGRGGGSLEDLWAFNEESVARAIAASKIPVISCVGHETDFTIADFVADLRAPTPSAAAELVTRAKTELLEQLDTLTSRLRSHISYQLEELEARLQNALSSRMLRHPRVWIDERMQDLDAVCARLAQAAQNRVGHWEKDLQHLLEKLSLLSPLSILSRGYAIAWAQPAGRLIKRADAVSKNQSIEVQLHQGRIYAEVQRTEI